MVAGALTSLAVVGLADERQDASPGAIQVGSRVRLRSTAVAGRPVGLVVAIDDRLLTLAEDKRVPTQVPVASITSLQVGLGKKRNTLKGLLIGAALGALLYAVDDQREESGGLLLVGGPLFGAGIGALVKTDRWQSVPLSSSTGRAGSSAPHAAISVTLGF
jgi:hypothetical protein